jgi:hypothetical protein
MTTAPPSRRRWPLLVVATLFTAVAGVVLLVLLLTSPAPWVPPRPAPTPEQVGAGRDALVQLRGASAIPSAHPITLGPQQLDGIAALASHGLRPDRLALTVQGGALHVTGSHALPGGRWLNAAVVAVRSGRGFPATHLTIGHLSLTDRWSRAILNVGRRVLAWRGVEVPPLDVMVRHVAIRDGTVSAIVDPPKPQGNIDGTAVTRRYCALAGAQRRAPATQFATQVRRAFIGAATPADNRAAFVALAILLIDDKADELATIARADIARCRVPAPTVTLHDRADLPKHWSLSAALAVGGGAQLAQAMGEWKELADSLTPQSAFAIGDPSGFSFVDISADRAGFRTAAAALQPDQAADRAIRLRVATDESLLPAILLGQPEGLTEAQFTSRYGSIGDPRYTATIDRIDAALGER